MAKFVDKMNLMQYKYFHNMVGREEEMHDLASMYVAGDYQLNENRRNVSPKEHRISLMMISKAKQRMPKFLYLSEEDQKRCSQELNAKSTSMAKQNGQRYVDLMMSLPFFQGVPIKQNIEVRPEALQKLSEREKKQKYELKEDGKYYSSFFTAPKLVLINGELFRHYLNREITQKDIERLEKLLPRDAHYIINVQDESQKDTACLVTRKDGKSHIDRLDRYHISQHIWLETLQTQSPELGSIALCLTDYLVEFEKMVKQQKRVHRETGDERNYASDKVRAAKYTDQNSIKIFDLKQSDLPTSYFAKKYGNRGVRRKTGYEMMPHTRRGHYRKCKNGKIVFVRSSIIHKEKYQGLQSAHRINEETQSFENLDEPNIQETDIHNETDTAETEEHGFTMGM